MYFNKFLNSNYMNYSSKNYTNQNNYVGAPPFTKDNDKLCKPGQNSLQVDGKYAMYAPYYKLGPVPVLNCPYYNYTLPYNYPKAPYPYKPDSKYYWYYPYYKTTK